MNIRFISFLWVLIGGYLFAQESIVISLGIRCLPAVQIAKYGLRSGAYPFDWNDTNFESLYLILQNDFNHFLDEVVVKDIGMLKTDGTILVRPAITEARYNMVFVHDFSSIDTITSEYATVKQRYTRRIKRFYDAIHSGKHIYFIRHLMTRAQAVQLTELLNTKFPSLSYTLIVTDYKQETQIDWHIPKVKNIYLGHPEDDWIRQAEDPQWAGILDEIKRSSLRTHGKGHKTDKNHTCCG